MSGTGTMIGDERKRGGTRTGTETVTGGETTTGAETTETMTAAGVRGVGTTDPGIPGADRARAIAGRRRLATADRPPRTHRRRL